MMVVPKGRARKIEVLGIPMDLGQGRRGVDMGPSALRYARVDAALEELGYEVVDHGNIEVPVAEAVRNGGTMPYLDTIREVCDRTTTAIRDLSSSSFLLFLGGDHSVSIGTVAGVARRGRTGLLWIDAHADFNTPDTSPSGNIHGMPLAAITGRGHPRLISVGGPGPSVAPQDVVLLGVRSVDSEERHLLSEAGITVFTMADVDALSIAETAKRATAALSHLDGVHVSLDLDVMEPDMAPGVGTPVRGGLTYREAHLLMERVSGSGIATSMDVAEINPILDVKNLTAELAVELVGSLLGRRILSVIE
jgi:arginase